MQTVKYIIWILIFGLILSTSCTPSQRVARLVKKYNLEKRDTVRVTDTIITLGVSKDTTIHFYQRDTVRIERGNLVMKYFYNTHDSTVYLQGECKGDTIYHETIREINSVSLTANKGIRERLIDWLINNILILLLLAVVLYILFRNRS